VAESVGGTGDWERLGWEGRKPAARKHRRDLREQGPERFGALPPEAVKIDREERP
jgi:hypothetical protein